MENDVLIQLLEEWIREIRVELKVLKEEHSSFKEEFMKISYSTMSYENKITQCKNLFDRYEKRLDDLEKKDAEFIKDIIKSDGEIQSSIERSIMEKRHCEENMKNFKSSIEKAIDKIHNKINWQWSTIVVLALGVIFKFLF